MRRQVVEYHKFDHIVREWDYHRLSSPLTDPVTAWSFVSPDASETHVTAVVSLAEANAPTRYVRLRGLTPDASYRDVATGTTYPASALMDVGIPLPLSVGDHRSYVFDLKRVGE